MSKLNRAAARERITPVFPKCKACRGYGVVSVKVGQTFETDSADEHLLAYRDYPCPHCADRKDLGLALAELTDADALIASQAAEIKSLMFQMGELADAAGWNHMESYLRQAEKQVALMKTLREALPFTEPQLRFIRELAWSLWAETSEKACRTMAGRIVKKIDSILSALAQVSTPATHAESATLGALLEAIEGLCVAPNCWCSTGEGNPHTQACLDMANTVTALSHSASPKEEQP